MAKDPAVLFYTSDFYVGTATMTDEQVGKYIRLLCLQHQQGRLTEQDMMSICKSYDEQVYRKFKIDEDGLYYNARMEKETNLRRAYSESRKRNASGSKSDKKQTTASHVQNISKTYASHMENEDEDINVNIDISDNEQKKSNLQTERFSEFWKVYPKKVGKEAARKAWMKVKPTAELHDQIIKAVEVQKQSEQWTRENGRFIPNPSTWLNQGRWDDELTIGGKASGQSISGKTGAPTLTGFKSAFDDDE